MDWTRTETKSGFYNLYEATAENGRGLLIVEERPAAAPLYWEVWRGDGNRVLHKGKSNTLDLAKAAVVEAAQGQGW